MKDYSFHVIIDAGHGGIRNGRYTTEPDKMFTFPDGLTIYEGVVNRKIAQMVGEGLKHEGICFSPVFDMVEDTPLTHRARAANAIYSHFPNSFLLSIHSNAGGGAGFEVFTSPGKTKSDEYAEIIIQQYMTDFPDFKFRTDLSDGDHDKEARFYMLTETKCPAVLVENLFFDNRKEAEFLISSDGQFRIALSLIKSILRIRNSLRKP